MFGHNGLSVLVPSAAIEEKNNPCGRCLCSSSLHVLINVSVSSFRVLNVAVIKLFVNALKQARPRYHSDRLCWKFYDPVLQNDGARGSHNTTYGLRRS